MSESETNSLTNEETKSPTIKNPTKKNLFSRKNVALFIVVVIVICLMNILPLLWAEDVSYIKEENHTSISASIYHHRRYHRSCEDSEYGCCEIYEKCKVVNNKITYKTYTIDPDRILARDTMKTNCKTLDQLINMYNLHYGKNDCGKFGCCSEVLDQCDKTIQQEKNIGNNEQLIDLYNQNSQNVKYSRVPKNDEIGSNCWNKQIYKKHTFIIKYIHHYPSPSDNKGDFILLVLLILFIMCLAVET
jgi:hypothetical protein